ncbi:MAG: glycoside hydrolase family 36 N-terminal domain-containing protein, partial [Plesiomonas shigelloides]
MTEKQRITLTGTETQLMIELGEYAEILHWGPKVNADMARSRIALQRPVPYGRLDNDVAMTLQPELGRGVFSSPGVEGHRNGQDWAPVFNITNIVQSENGVLITSTDPLAGLALQTELQLDTHDVVKTRHTLTNLNAGEYQVNRLATTLPLPARA